jgi:hypothetical protein
MTVAACRLISLCLTVATSRPVSLCLAVATCWPVSLCLAVATLLAGHLCFSLTLVQTLRRNTVLFEVTLGDEQGAPWTLTV